MKTARAMWYDNGVVVLNDDWTKTRVDIPWEQAIDEWIKAKCQAK